MNILFNTKAAKPPYVLVAEFNAAAHAPDPKVYEEMVVRPGMQLYRRRDLVAATP